METKKNIGIWMDHSNANLIDLNDPKNNRTITSDFTNTVKEAVLSRSEFTLHNKEQQMNEQFYSAIAAVILEYDHVFLFGPTNAKIEFFNYIREDLRFNALKIDVEPADKMTDNQQIACVKKHFDPKLSYS